MASAYSQVVLEPRASVLMSVRVSMRSVFLPILIVTVETSIENRHLGGKGRSTEGTGGFES
jgi:hypothetical protein